MQEVTVYDKEKEYKDIIVPLIQELKIACNLNKMPMFVTVAVQNSEEGTTFKNDAVLATTGVQLKDNRIAKILLRINGFETERSEKVNKAIQILEEFLEETGSNYAFLDENGNTENASVIDVELKEDLIPEFNNIASGLLDVKL